MVPHIFRPKVLNGLALMMVLPEKDINLSLSVDPNPHLPIWKPVPPLLLLTIPLMSSFQTLGLNLLLRPT